MAEDDSPRAGPPPEAIEEREGPTLSRTGRFHIPHRGGARIEVGEPIKVGGVKPWMCAVKLVGQKRDDTLAGEKDPRAAADAAEPESTQTLLVRTGRGTTPEEAQREALANLALVYGSPVAPPPVTTIELRESQRPMKAALRFAPPDEPASERPSILDRLKGVFGKK
jgi:hypothetical protein